MPTSDPSYLFTIRFKLFSMLSQDRYCDENGAVRK